MKIRSALAGALLLAGCGSSGGDGAAVGGSKIESIVTDAAAVQALAPQTAGKSDAGTASGLLG